MILAHRGDSFHAPENTIQAARMGFEAGADGWELDIRMTRDGRLVVLHDESLARTTDVSRRFEGDPRGDSGYLVGDFRFDEVMTLDAGSWFLDPAGGPRSAAGFGTTESLSQEAQGDYRSGATRVPSLMCALELTADLNWKVNVEIKADPERRLMVVRAMIDEVARTGLIPSVTVSSFDHEAVVMVSELEPRLATGLLLSGPVEGNGRERLESMRADALHVSAESCLNADGTLSELARRPVVPWLVYTMNDAGPSGLAGRLAEAGVTGLFTDDPASFRRRFHPCLTSS